MSLVVSLRIPDGVVVAADSLSTVQHRVELRPEFKTNCPKCKKSIELKDLPPLQLPMPMALSTSSFAQKLFPLHGRFGIGAFGWSILQERTVGYHIETLQRETKRADLEGVTAAAEAVLDRFDALIHAQVEDIASAPDNFYPVGFQVVGYDGQEGKTIEVKIGKKSRLIQHRGLGCTGSGTMHIVSKLWELADKDPSQQAKFPSFSLQDAIDYADFLIRTTASYQRFALMIPNVGGEVDVALVTPYQGFRWIRQKALARAVLGEEARSDD